MSEFEQVINDKKSFGNGKDESALYILRSKNKNSKREKSKARKKKEKKQAGKRNGRSNGQHHDDASEEGYEVE